MLPGVELGGNVVTYEEQILARDLPSRSSSSAPAPSAWSSPSSELRCQGHDHRVPRPHPADGGRGRLEGAHPPVQEVRRRHPHLDQVETVVDHGDHVTVSYTPKDGEQASIDAEKVMMSIGFAPNIEGFGLEEPAAGHRSRRDRVDDFMRTSVPHIYAIGDVTAKLQLAHVAEAQGVVAAETIGKAETMALGDYRMMPRGRSARRSSPRSAPPSSRRATPATTSRSRIPPRRTARPRPRRTIGFVSWSRTASTSSFWAGPDRSGCSELLPEPRWPRSGS